MKKKVWIWFLIAAMFLCSCTQKRKELTFPKTAWGMSVGEVFDSYEITKEDTAAYNETGRGVTFVIEGYELFGENTSIIRFQFIDVADNGNPRLCGVQVSYPKSADMNHVFEEMEEMYGETESAITTYDVYQAMDELTERSYTESEQLKLWSTGSVGETVSEDESVLYRDRWIGLQPNLNAENWDVFSENAKMVTVLWWNQEDVKALQFEAYHWLVYDEISRQISGQSEQQ